MRHVKRLPRAVRDQDTAGVISRRRDVPSSTAAYLASLQRYASEHSHALVIDRIVHGFAEGIAGGQVCAGFNAIGCVYGSQTVISDTDFQGQGHGAIDVVIRLQVSLNRTLRNDRI